MTKYIKIYVKTYDGLEEVVNTKSLQNISQSLEDHTHYLNISQLSSNSTITSSDHLGYFICTKTITITVPKIGKNGFCFYIKNGTTTEVTTIKPSDCKIDGSNSSITLSPLECAFLASDGSNWWRLDTSARFQ